MPRKKTGPPSVGTRNPSDAAAPSSPGIPALATVYHPELGSAAVPARAAASWAAEGWTDQPPAPGAAPTSDVAVTPDPDGPATDPSRTSVKEH